MIKLYCPECGNGLMLPLPKIWDGGPSLQLHEELCTCGYLSRWRSTGLSCEPRWYTLTKCPVLGCTDQKEYVVPMCTAHWGLVPSAIAARVWAVIPLGLERVRAMKQLVRDVESGKYGAPIQEKKSVFSIDFGVI